MAIKYLSGNRLTALSTDLVVDKDITWSTSANVTVSGGQVTKNSGGTAYNAGTSSTETSDKITFTNFTEGNYNTWAGINTGSGSPPLGFTGIFWRQAGTSDMRIMSDTTALKTLSDTISSSDTYEIRNVSGTAKFYKNGTEQTGFTNPSYPSGVINTIIYQENTGVKGTLEAPKLGSTSPTPTLSDDFSGTDDWTDSDSSNTGVNTTTDLIDFTIDSSADTTTYDLTTVSNTAWVLRFKVKWLTKNTNTYATFGISDNTSAPNVSQDIISMQWRHDGSNKWYGSHDSDGSAPNGLHKDNLVSFDPSTNTDYYFEIVRQTATTYIVRRYSDSTYSTVSDSASGTCASTTQTLRYIKFAGWTDCNATSTAEIDDVKFYNGITSASATDNAVTVPNGSVAEETNTGIHRIWSGSAWTEVS